MEVFGGRPPTARTAPNEGSPSPRDTRSVPIERQPNVDGNEDIPSERASSSNGVESTLNERPFHSTDTFPTRIKQLFVQYGTTTVLNEPSSILDEVEAAMNERPRHIHSINTTADKYTTNHVHNHHHLKFDSSSLKDAMQCLVGQVRSLQSLSRLTVYQTILRQGRDYDSSVRSLKLPTPLADFLRKFEN